MSGDWCLTFLYGRVILRVKWENGCHGTLTCISLCVVNIVESVLPFRVPFPKGRLIGDWSQTKKEEGKEGLGSRNTAKQREGIEVYRAWPPVCRHLHVCVSVSTPLSQKPQSVGVSILSTGDQILRLKRNWTEKWHMFLWKARLDRGPVLKAEARTSCC